jgi:MFS family permease
VPAVHDEFSYLLAADTFVHGRLTNPPHPMWIYLDTFHVMQHPTYASIYPPAQGAVLAIGQLLGNPWFGVLLSMGLLFATLLWMLQGWLPPQWALLGAALAFFQFGIFSYWMNSYWGGAAGAIGGALVTGALPRVLRRQGLGDALLLGLGAAILANARPFEGALVCLPVGIVLISWLGGRRSPSWRTTFPRIVLPLGGILIVTAAFILFYNWRVTGNALLLPHEVENRMDSIPNFVGEHVRPMHYLNHQFEVFYNHWTVNQSLYKWEDFPSFSLKKLATFQEFFLQWPLPISFAVLPWVLLDRRIRFLVAQFALYSVGALMVAWFQPHYAAPAMATFVALVIQMLRHLRQWKFRGRPVGVGLTRALFLLTALSFPVCMMHVMKNPYTDTCLGAGPTGNWSRAAITARLGALPGKYLVIVRYSQQQHNANEEWVYNGANVDESKIVWARYIPEISMQPLLDYFHDRSVWVVDADDSPPRLTPYSSASPGSGAAQH